ncbi:MAG TPA: HAD-IA family hydrolase [Verrucomicrobiae bacterium]|nr:HAD-IA family hydrolase [Verrucomicrobiae bacterium]
MRLTGIQAVTFDVGGTLIEPWPSVGHVYAEVAASHGAANLSHEELQRRFVTAFHRRAHSINSAEEWAEIVDETFAGLVAEPPSKTFFPDLYERFAQAAAWRIYPDVEPTLAALAGRGLKLGVISNWDGRLRPLLITLGLARSFETMVVSCEVSQSKPAPAIFKKAAEQLHAPPDTILHVGDSFEMDVAGARTAGFKALQIERNAKPLHAGQIESLLDLLPLV